MTVSHGPVQENKLPLLALLYEFTNESIFLVMLLLHAWDTATVEGGYKTDEVMRVLRA